MDERAYEPEIIARERSLLMEIERYVDPDPMRVHLQADLTALIPGHVGAASWEAQVDIDYLPGELLVKPESLAGYLSQFRFEQVKPEDLVVMIYTDVLAAAKPRRLRVLMSYSTCSNVSVAYEKGEA